MADAAAVILSVIEKLDNLLLQKSDRENDHERLCSLRLEKKDLLVGMMDLWENDKEMLYSLLVRVENVRDYTLYSFLGEMEDLWQLNCREKLHTLLVQMLDLKTDWEKFFSLAVETADLWKDGEGKLYREKLYSWVAKKTGLWEDSQRKLNKKKLYRWLAKKTGLWEEDKLFRLLKGMILGEYKERLGLFQENWEYVELLRNDLRLILDLLNKLEDEGSSHGHLHYFMSDVLETAHDVRLLVHLKDSDPFILFLQMINFTLYSSVRNEANFLKFFNETKLIHERLQETEKRVRKFGGDETSQMNNVREESDHHVVGLKEDVELLLRTDETTIRILGMAGSGKTTLAREFYNHQEIVDGFECRGWVCLSSWKLSRKELLIKLIRQFIHSKRDDMLIEKMENKALRQMLHQHLQGKPYVLVLDDVSEVTYLRYVFEALPQDKKSRLLFTTGNHEISCKLRPYRDCEHKMKTLDDDMSWQLLLQTALRSDEEFPKQFKKKGREMLMRKCGGLPLAIKEVGKHWAEKRRSGSEWKELVVEESLMNLELSETLVALESTYLNMDPEVKPCFLRLASFKEGTIIRIKKLIQIWTAGGLIEDQSKSGLYNLNQQSIIEEMIEPTDMDRKTAIRFTKMIRINVHFHRLSITKAVDEIGFEILRNDVSNQASHEPRHHRVIHCSRDSMFNYNYSSTNHDEHLLSLFFHGGGGYSSVCHPSYWKHFEQLKVLDMEGFGLKILPETVGDLTELRYLGLRNNYIQELPQSLRRLKMIEVLDIAQNFMVEVPDILWEMDCLRHLYVSDIICQKPLKIDALMNLETLTYISVDNWTYELSDMKNKMTNLHRLGIEEVDGNSNVSKLFTSLAELTKLRDLILRGFRFRSMPSLDELGLLQNLTQLKLEGRPTRLPSATNFPPKIYLLSLVNSCLDEDPMRILEKLPKLYILKLQNAYTGHEMVISNKGFHELNHLVIRELRNLRNIVKVGEDGLWRLERLEINSCPYLETIPQDFFWRLDHPRSQSLKCATL
ncbi:hypothetical protein C2S52_018854 [Perilla frutescens var. hirtella]|nr:hypothetical protein C2S52_018854 [Perilla frutescens var. hirtella]